LPNFSERSNKDANLLAIEKRDNERNSKEAHIIPKST